MLSQYLQKRLLGAEAARVVPEDAIAGLAEFQPFEARPERGVGTKTHCIGLVVMALQGALHQFSS
jgi:hypothetical protein